MIVKVELYYEVTSKVKGPLPKDIKGSIAKMVMDTSPEVIDGYTDLNTPREQILTLTRLSGEAIEKIRTGR